MGSPPSEAPASELPASEVPASRGPASETVARWLHPPHSNDSPTKASRVTKRFKRLIPQSARQLKRENRCVVERVGEHRSDEHAGPLVHHCSADPDEEDRNHGGGWVDDGED